MGRGVYYNEFNRQKAAWLRHLIEEGEIAHGVVDERSITEVPPEDLAGFAQCHFFAGIGLWSLCLRRAGWPDDRPVWTGSCPCGPFSAAGRRRGFEDERHLWPEWFRLISVRRPDVIFGEQSDQALAWLDLVQSDLEGCCYAVGPAVLPAAGFGGAHERHRIGFVADADNAQWWSDRAPWNDGQWPTPERVQSHGHAGNGGAEHFGQRLADLSSVGWRQEHSDDGRGPFRGTSEGWTPGSWSSGHFDWFRCADERWRPAEPGTCPLADAHPSRMGRLRGYGDAIDVETFTQLISAYLEVAPPRQLAA